MIANKHVHLIGVVLVAVALVLGPHSGLSALADADGTPATSAFTFQGQLKGVDGQPIHNTCTFVFALWDAAEGGAQVGAERSAENVAVANGFFTVELDFGNQFSGDARWIAIRTRCNGDAADTQMDGRILLTSSPYAIGLMPGAVINATGERGLTVNANGNAIVGVGTKNDYAAIYGGDQSAQGGFGVYGLSTKGSGVYGESTERSGVRGVAHGKDQAGVVGLHDGSGYGVYGQSKGAGLVGVSTDWIGVYGSSVTYRGLSGISESNLGVYGESAASDGIRGVSKGKGKAGVVGVSETDGIGVFGLGRNGGTGVYGRSEGDADFAVYADGKLGGKVVHIFGGADLAEWYNVSSPSEPGTLLIIDDAQPGLLKPSAGAYDTRVAGIVSGAGGVNPGMTLQQSGVLDGDTQVAIAGRVYVKATAANGPIHPGDLLTTSDLAGHAMKATDRDRAYGAVIGKAMSELASDEGLVLVLVNLQ
ncbi:MAG: hypothetical protein KDD78_09150 [Caldilineaceae bacterium]|nr:hypothetical protein [Caldilineaceae bacterium]